MELNFNEPTDNNNNYWNNSNQKPKKSKITYDDILSSLNLVVNETGVLQYMTPKNNVEQTQTYMPQVQNQSYSFPQKKEENIKISKIEPQLKNSAIYNKYFKNYKDEQLQEEEVKPLTIAEYNKMVLQNRIRKIQEQKRISQIKSKKMFFMSENKATITYTTPHNLNRLFKY
jgi:hypothetical protein